MPPAVVRVGTLRPHVSQGGAPCGGTRLRAVRGAPVPADLGLAFLRRFCHGCEVLPCEAATPAVTS